MARFLLVFAFLLPLALPSVAFAFHTPTHLFYVPCGYKYYNETEAKTLTEAAVTFNTNNAGAIKSGTVTAKKPVFEGQVKPTEGTPGGEVGGECGFGSVIAIASSIINGLIGVGVIVATMGFAYAGFLYITAAGSEEKIKHAHSIFVKVLIGFALMLGAWLIAKAFETVFLTEAAKARSFLAN